jgi:hypothetical protein
MKAWLMVLLLPLVAQAANETLHSRDFAYGIALEVDGDGAIYSLPLPEAVYRATTRADLGDMRIFNGYGEVVPHLLRQESGAGESRREPVRLNFFPLYRERPWEEEIKHIRIADDGRGTIVDIERRPAAQGVARTVDHYLVDASGVEATVDKLLLEWDTVAEGFLETVRIEYSNDLVHWHHLVAAATLADLTYEGYRLGQHEIPLPPQSARYYRISWPLGEKGLRLTGLRAEVLHTADAPPRQWRELPATAGPAAAGEYLFELPGNTPLDRIQVMLPQSNTVVRVTLSSRDSEEAPWQPRYQGLLYTLQRQGHTLSSDAVALNRVSDSYWRLQVAQEGGGLGSGMPQLKVGWVPHRLVFVARGEMPFTLAFGAATVGPAASGFGDLLRRLEQRPADKGYIKLAHAGGRFELGGERRLQPPRAPLPWKTWLLWALLVFGVLLLAAMARSLYRQMSHNDRI